MNHLAEYGNGEAIHTIDVFNTVPKDALDLNTDFSPQSFTYEHFNDFPRKVGWELKESKLIRRPEPVLKKLGQVLQAWLFFGLIFTVVRTDKGSLLDVEALLEEQDQQKISTKALEQALKVWAKWAISAGSTIRPKWIKTGLVLQRAREVVLSHCSDDGKPWDEEEKYTWRPSKENAHNYMDNKVALSLMLIGETLSTIHGNIDRKAGGAATGWHAYEVPGWGHPRYVLDEMKSLGWCPRNIYLLRRQLGKNATLLLGAYYSNYKNRVHVDQRRHIECNSKEACKAKSEKEKDGQIYYATAHHDVECKERTQTVCEDSGALGPDLVEVNRILDKDDYGVFPLVKFRFVERFGSKTIDGLDVIQGDKTTTEYVTISHVWSDGYGNEGGNEIWRCQLEFIRRLLEKVVESDATPFWMDTLLIPVASRTDDEKRRKKKAIQQIFTVFDQSECTIVMDRGLISMPIGNSHTEPCLTALKIISSGWMRRLWTLQEAFLSRRLMLAFEEGQSGGLQDYTKIRADIQKKANENTSVIAGLIKRELAWSVANDAEYKERPSDLTTQAMVKVANTWRAARWRTTSNQAHETLALATLLGIQITHYRSDKITEAGMEAPAKNCNKTEETIHLHELVVEFWKSVDRFEEGCIPAGTIFLPGKRVNSDRFQGFGWAPETFMTPEEAPHPDPLSLLKDPTMLRWDRETCYGLVVTCPGFLLYFDDDKDHSIRTTILSTVAEAGADRFKFPVNNSFNEWYGVNPVSEAGNTNAEAPLGRQSQLGIILSRSSPHESPSETGLLVEIYKPYEPSQASSRDRNVHFAQILFHISIRRLGSHPSIDDANSCDIFGETLSDRQKWCVDGFRHGRFPDERTKGSEAPGTKPRQGKPGSVLLGFLSSSKGYMYK